MTTRQEHPVSSFALDVYWASGRPADPELELHLVGCARCRAYLDRLELTFETSHLTIDPRRAPPRPAKPPRSWVWPSAAALALAAGALLVIRARPLEVTPYVGVKGTPAVQLLVHRGRSTAVWDGASPVRAGDSLALRVACEGEDHVTVATPVAGDWTRLSEVPCPDGGEALPFTLVVDDAPGGERLAVVLSHGPLDDATLRRDVTDHVQSADTWVVDFTLAKETGTER